MATSIFARLRLVGIARADQQVDLHVLHEERQVADHTGHEIAQAGAVGESAHGVVGVGLLPEVSVDGPDAVDGVAQKADIEEEVAGRLRQRVADLVAGESAQVGPGVEEAQQVGIEDQSFVGGSLQFRETLAETVVENVFDRRTGVLENVIVKNDQPHVGRTDDGIIARSRMSHPGPAVSQLEALEAESIQIVREAAAEFSRPVLLYSIGKDSSVLLRIAGKAFAPGRIPFPLLHVDTGYKFRRDDRLSRLDRGAAGAEPDRSLQPAGAGRGRRPVPPGRPASAAPS